MDLIWLQIQDSQKKTAYKIQSAVLTKRDATFLLLFDVAFFYIVYRYDSFGFV